MCGRYTLGKQPQSLLDFFHLHGDVPAYHLSWNIAPSQTAPVIIHDPKQRRVCQMMRWGLVPAWSSGPDTRYSMINARVETVAQKPAYRQAFKRQRCLVPCDGFYEWAVMDGKEAGKQPYYISRQDRQLFALAGIWDRWSAPLQDQVLYSFSIITTPANQFMQEIHQRMPAILTEDQYDTWLVDQNQEQDALLSLLNSYQPDDLVKYPVSRDVNSPANDSSELTRAIEV